MRGRWTQRARQVLACLVLQYAVLFGAPVRKEEIEALQRAWSQPAVVDVEADDRE